jgi:Tol biopolymer transport system component
MMPRFPLRTPAALVAAACALAGCNGDSTGHVDHTLVVTASGRAERSSDLALSVTDQGAAVPPAQVTWAVSPAGAATVDAAGTAHLASAGSVTFTATAGGFTGKTTVSVAVPPTVVFEKLANGNYDIWQASLDGGEPKQLTTSLSDDLSPSAAHGTIVFVSYRNGNADVYSMPVGGGTETQVTASAANELAPAISPDGGKVAYTNDGSGVDKLWTASVTGAGAQVAAPSFGFGGSIDASPGWAPSSSRVAFVSTADGTPDIYSLDVPGGTPAHMVGGSFVEIQPAWSPDGSKLAFVSNRDGDTEIYMLTIATGTVTRLTNRAGTDASPAWLSDGRLVYVAYTGNQPALRWMDPAQPGVTHDIPTGGAARHPSGVL